MPRRPRRRPTRGRRLRRARTARRPRTRTQARRRGERPSAADGRARGTGRAVRSRRFPGCASFLPTEERAEEAPGRDRYSLLYRSTVAGASPDRRVPGNGHGHSGRTGTAGHSHERCGFPAGGSGVDTIPAAARLTTIRAKRGREESRALAPWQGAPREAPRGVI